MGIVHGPYDVAEWITMKMLREDNTNMAKLSYDKHVFAIKCNNRCLKEFYKKEAA